MGSRGNNMDRCTDITVQGGQRDHSSSSSSSSSSAWPEHRAGNVVGPEKGQSPIWTILGYERLCLHQAFLVLRHRLTQVSMSEGWELVENTGLPGQPRPLLLPTLPILAGQGSAGPHSLLPVSSASYSPSQLRGVTISGNKEGQGPVGQLPQLQNSGGLSSISWPGFLAWIWT